MIVASYIAAFLLGGILGLCANGLWREGYINPPTRAELFERNDKLQEAINSAIMDLEKASTYMTKRRRIKEAVADVLMRTVMEAKHESEEDDGGE